MARYSSRVFPGTDSWMITAGSRMGMAMERINLLKWSPCGSYIAAGEVVAQFII